MELYCLWIVLCGTVAFSLYALDKDRAKRGKWRIKERTLLLVSLAGGMIGGLCGMYLCRHKTKHRYFAVVNWLSLALWAAIGCLVWTKVGFVLL